MSEDRERKRAMWRAIHRRTAVHLGRLRTKAIAKAHPSGAGSGQRTQDGCIVHRRWCADAGRPTRFKPSSPSPTDAVRDGSAKLGHPVQNVTREHGLTPLPR